MSECQNLQQQLDEYLSDRISDFEKRRIDNHLRHCPNCAAEVKDYREAIDELRSAAREVEIEPSLSLQYSLNRLASEGSRPDFVLVQWIRKYLALTELLVKRREEDHKDRKTQRLGSE
jgi:hypothetical protein